MLECACKAKGTAYGTQPLLCFKPVPEWTKFAATASNRNIYDKREEYTELSFMATKLFLQGN